MTPSASTRISIRWPPSPASEPTDTLVLSLNGYYVDLRILLSDGSIDWALAGRRIPLPDGKVEFTHTIDSHSSSAPDVGTFTKLPNGDDLETGSMPAPHMGGEIHPYEEVWRELDFGDEDKSWIIETTSEGNKQEEYKAMYARIGKYYIAISRQGNTFKALRQDYNLSTQAWEVKYAVGGGAEDMVRTRENFENGVREYDWKVGDKAFVKDEHVGGEAEMVVIRALEGVFR